MRARSVKLVKVDAACVFAKFVCKYAYDAAELLILDSLSSRP